LRGVFFGFSEPKFGTILASFFCNFLKKPNKFGILIQNLSTYWCKKFICAEIAHLVLFQSVTMCDTLNDSYKHQNFVKIGFKKTNQKKHFFIYWYSDMIDVYNPFHFLWFSHISTFFVSALLQYPLSQRILSESFWNFCFPFSGPKLNCHVILSRISRYIPQYITNCPVEQVNLP
jgi:hypothetical protein